MKTITERIAEWQCTHQNDDGTVRKLTAEELDDFSLVENHILLKCE